MKPEAALAALDTGAQAPPHQADVRSEGAPAQLDAAAQAAPQHPPCSPPDGLHVVRIQILCDNVTQQLLLTLTLHNSYTCKAYRVLLKCIIPVTFV